MFAIERQQEMIRILKTRKSVTVSELSQRFEIGEATIRRDLAKLEKNGLLKRTYGGAVLLEGLDLEIPLSVRETEQRKEKDIIGHLAAQLVQDGEILIIDSSSTSLKTVPHLQGKSKLTVITNGAKTAVELGNISGIKVYGTGGNLRENSLSFTGEHARRCIQNFYADTLFFSCRGVSIEKGLLDSNEDEAELRRLMIQNCKKAVLLCDHTKFNQTSFCRIGGFSDVDLVITDVEPSEPWRSFLKEHGITLIHGE